MAKANFKTSEVIRFKKRDKDDWSLNNVVMDNYDLDAETPYGDRISEKSSKIHSEGVLKWTKNKYYGTGKYHDKVNKFIDETTLMENKAHSNTSTWFVPARIRDEKDA